MTEITEAIRVNQRQLQDSAHFKKNESHRRNKTEVDWLSITVVRPMLINSSLVWWR